MASNTTSPFTVKAPLGLGVHSPPGLTAELVAPVLVLAWPSVVDALEFVALESLVPGSLVETGCEVELWVWVVVGAVAEV